MIRALAVAGSALVVLALAVQAGAEDARAPAATPPAAQGAPAPSSAAQSVVFSGYAQVDWVVHDQRSVSEVDVSREAPLNQERFLLRRGRLRAEHERGLLSAALELDANTVNSPALRPINAELSFRAPTKREANSPEVIASVGLLKIPFGLELLERELERPWLERSTVVRALFAGGYDLGFRVRGRYSYMNLTLSAMNGHPLGDRVFAGLAPGKTKELVGRLGCSANPTEILKLDFGVSGDGGQGFHEGTPATKDELSWSDDNGDGLVSATEIQVVPGSASSPSRQFSRFALGADARIELMWRPAFPFTLRAELVRAKNLDRGVELANPIGAGYSLREFGWYVGASQQFGTWGLLGVRYDRYDPDRDAHEQRASQVLVRDRSYSTLAVMLAGRYEQGQLSMQYDRNWNSLGRTTSGAPASIASDTLTARAQVSF